MNYPNSTTKYWQQTAVIAVVGIFCLLAVACSPQGERPSSSQFIVYFGDSIGDPESPAFIEDLSNYVGSPLLYVQPTTSGEHVLRVVKSVSEQQMLKLIQRLDTHQDVENVEMDLLVYRESAKS